MLKRKKSIIIEAKYIVGSLLIVLFPLLLWGYPYVANELRYEPYRYTRDIRPYPPEEDIKIQDITEDQRRSSYTCRPFECSAHQEFYIESCDIRVYGGKPHGVASNTSTTVPDNNLCDIFTKWMKKDGRINLTEPSPKNPYVKLRFTLFNDYVNRGSIDFFEVNEEKPQTTWEENGLIFQSKKTFNSSYIFDYMIREIMDAYK